MKIGGAALLLLLALCIALGLAVTHVGNRAVDVWAVQAQQPKSAAETILQSRQTPSSMADEGNTAWFGAGLLALALTAIGCTLFAMRNGAELLRQWRLAHKRQSRSPRPLSTLPDARWSETPQARLVQYLPETNDEQLLDPEH